VLLVGVIALLAYVKISNPHQEYSTTDYWQTATVEDVYKLPEEALEPRNQNGPVLMWASSTTNDPMVIAALISRGVDVNERDIDFKGTALSAAAYQNPNAAIIDELVKHGAKVNIVLGMLKKSPLILAAEANDAAVTERLLFHGADPQYKDLFESTAYIQAVRSKNAEVVAIYEKLEQL